MEFTFGRARPEAYCSHRHPRGTELSGMFLQLCRGRQQDLDTRLVLGCLRCDRREFGRHVETFSLFTGENTFNLASFQEKVQELLQEQENLVIVLNSPAHNPTGFSLSLREWQAVLSFCEKWPGTRRKNYSVGGYRLYGLCR